MFLSIIIPSYNESQTINEVLERLSALKFPSFVEKSEIIIVDDCSTDGSADILKRIEKKHNSVKIVTHTTNRGKGKAVMTGVSASSGDVILIQDADLELFPEDIPSMLVAMDELKVQFINGSRYLPGVVRPAGSYVRYLGNKIFSILTSLLINTHITDMACGYKMISRKFYDQINPKEEKFGLEAELILKALKINKRAIAEVPVRYKPRTIVEGKKIGGVDIFKILIAIFRISLLGK